MGGIEVGTKFMSAIDGTVTGIKFYKTAGNIGTHTVQLYKANTMYVAAYHSSLGNYSATFYGLKNAITNGPLTALADSTLGLNGVFRYTDILDFPIYGFESSNYWVDVLVVY